MPPHRSLEPISDETLGIALNRAPKDHYVYWTGGSYRAQKGSLRSESLKTITEVKIPIPLPDFLTRAARIKGNIGYDPDVVRGGLSLHQGASPAVYFLLREDQDGNFRTVDSIPFPDGYSQALKQDQIIFTWGSVEKERRRRQDLWASLKKEGGPTGVSPQTLRDLRIYGGAQGVWVDQRETKHLGKIGSGVAVGLLHRGDIYPDDFSEDCVLYHYPKTKRPEARDIGEINAIKEAGNLVLPVFLISNNSSNSKLRDVRLAWVEDCDDQSEIALVSFQEKPPEKKSSYDDLPFSLDGKNSSKTTQTKSRDGQQKFKFDVLKRYGSHCCVCGIGISEVLDAAHIKDKAKNGSDDPRNGLILCATHHRAFDGGLFAIEPETMKLVFRKTGPEPNALDIKFSSLNHLKNLPHIDALNWRWNIWLKTLK